MTESFSFGGNSNKTFSFGPQGAQPGASITGTVLDLAEVQQVNFDTKKPEFWDNGDPKMQHRLTLQTQLRDPLDPNDNGVRDVYLRGRRKPHDNGARSTICAVLDAVKATTGGLSLQKGGTLTITWTSGMGFSGDPRNYTATYTAPGMTLAAAAPAAQPQQPAWSQPAPAQQTVPPTAHAPAQTVSTEVGAVNTATGEIAAPAAAGPYLPPGCTPEAVAAVKAAGQDPRSIWPDYRD